jgi:hypothetical protein
VKDETSKAAQAAVGYHKHKRPHGKKLANKGSRKIAKGKIAKGDY